MKIAIRPLVFETNSSSTHSIVCVRSDEAREYLAQVGKAVDVYDWMFPDDDDLYTAQEVLDDLVALGAKIDGKTLDLTGIDPEKYDFGYVNEKVLVTPGYKVLLTLAMRNEFGYQDDWSEDARPIREIKDILGMEEIVIPEGLNGVDHQSVDELYWEILRYGVDYFSLRKNLVIKLGHD